jgi:hypothetical protein
MTNNGTLRLPLSPIGLHDSDEEGSAIDTPPDPVDVATLPSTSAVSSYASFATGTFATPATISFSESILKPSTASIATPSNTAEVNLPPEPSADPDGNDEDGDDGVDPSASFWDWLTGKIDQIWDKLTGSPS